MALASISRTGGSITVARTTDEVEALRDAWRELQSDELTSDLDYHLGVIAASERAERPHVVLLEEGGSPRALAVGRIERLPLPCKVGYRTIMAPTVRSLTVVYEGLLGEIDETVAGLLLESLRGEVAGGGADVLLFRNLRLESPVYRLATSLPSFVERQHVAPRVVCRELTLPESYDAFLRSLSRSTREGIRRYEKRFLKEFDGRVDVVSYRGAADLDRVFADLEHVAARAWQRGLGVGLRDDVEHRDRLRRSMERGWFRAWVVSVDSTPVAFWQGDAYRGRFRSGIPGYDPEYADHRVGSFVLQRAIADLCADPDVRVIDFGFGDAEYKRRVADRSWEVGDVVVYARRPRPVAINLTRSLVLRGADLAQRAAAKAGLDASVKRGWRQRLRPKVTE